MSAGKFLLMGAVAYASKVVNIWDGFKQYFHDRGLKFDYVLYSNYEAQVEAQVRGHIDVAWNSPLAWLQSERAAKGLGKTAEAICMRDSDQDLTSIVLVRSDGAVRSIQDLKGKRVAVGASDSPQAKLIPVSFLLDQGLAPGDLTVVPFDKQLGKHGDHVGGERDAVRALLRGEVEAACILDGNHLNFIHEGSLTVGATSILAQTPPFDHCNFTVIGNAGTERVVRFRELLLEMSYADPAVRPLMDLEGLKRWLPGRVKGYSQLAAAVDRFGTIDGFVEDLIRQCR